MGERVYVDQANSTVRLVNPAVTTDEIVLGDEARVDPESLATYIAGLSYFDFRDLNYALGDHNISLLK